ncbi:RadC family protein [Pseudidiomarina terrestris]|uniref:DNA repair protein RadC n=1 Tax=Pseudidiomarina terrestris TaxID=2820060 RepID=A0AAW7R388_9GAMM|nr:MULTISPECIES: DNA repair protein RadC [unclassified Pseudidiomarina]MDN7125583.1 DNA repair protein RadC [Pseudidiomarina sp. 1APP75-32.1]MDN7126169.1 DNA repair protein RadC [Pseudidiomarina sp. 1APR75-33.1]MDN7130554.1 DNA repair protein RadC [Pseudidiomarina sp. 1APR75-15]MDN7134195.1 DNA repair protein RadC [Pseudidiomarina sp. 1ASP75-5]MDN7137118.1 DNA repair protein RadC [Pseudidiomarina sp. 1ASP75-14]
MSTVKNWPAQERPREKMAELGVSALSDAELLAILLGTGVRGKDVVTYARELLHAFEGIGGMLAASTKELLQQPGLGPARVMQLQVVMEISRRYLAWQLRRDEGFTQPAMVRDYLTAQLRHQQREVFVVLLLDSQHRLLKYVELFHGTINAAPVYPREIIKLVMQHNAAAVILAHNHPSGVAEPSQADQRVTDRLKNALTMIDVALLDHFVIGSGEPVSFAERGLL